MNELFDYDDFDLRVQTIESALNAAEQARKEGNAELCRNHLNFARRLHECNVNSVQLEKLFQQ